MAIKRDVGYFYDKLQPIEDLHSHLEELLDKRRKLILGRNGEAIGASVNELVESMEDTLAPLKELERLQAAAVACYLGEDVSSPSKIADKEKDLQKLRSVADDFSAWKGKFAPDMSQEEIDAEIDELDMMALGVLCAMGFLKNKSVVLNHTREEFKVTLMDDKKPAGRIRGMHLW